MRVPLRSAIRSPAPVILRDREAPPLILQGGTVVDAAGTRSVCDVLIEGDRILGIGPGLAGERDGAGEVIDVAGRSVSAGLIDIWWRPDESRTGTVVEIAEALHELLRSGVTTVHLVGVEPEVGFAVRRGVIEGLLSGPRVLFGGGVIAGEITEGSESARSSQSVLVEARRLAARADLLTVATSEERGSDMVVHTVERLADDLRRPLLVMDTSAARVRCRHGETWAIVEGAGGAATAVVRSGNAMSWSSAVEGTASAARALGVQDRLGVLAAGMVAEVVVAGEASSPFPLVAAPELVVHARPTAPWEGDLESAD